MMTNPPPPPISLCLDVTCPVARRTGCAASTRKGHASPNCPQNRRHEMRCAEFSLRKTSSWKSWWSRHTSTGPAKHRAARHAALSYLLKVRSFSADWYSSESRWEHLVQTCAAQSGKGKITQYRLTQLRVTKVRSYSTEQHSGNGKITQYRPTHLRVAKVRPHSTDLHSSE